MGTLELIIGPMFSGKTTELLRRLVVSADLGLKVLYINHSLDSRSTNNFSSHNALYKELPSKIKSVKTNTLFSLPIDPLSFDVIGIDEAQFFDLSPYVSTMVDYHHKKVIVAGLSSDCNREKFGAILDLIPHADTVTKINSYCKLCLEKNPRLIREAPFTMRIAIKNERNVIDIGGSEKYKPVCRPCYLANLDDNKE